MKDKLPKSSKELEKLILEYQENCRFGGIPDYDSLGKHLKETTLNDPDAPPMAKFMAQLDQGDGNFILGITRFWDFCDQVKEHQLANNISSVLWDEKKLKDHTIRYPLVGDYLLVMPQDIQICSRYKHKVVKKYLEFVAYYDLPLYEVAPTKMGELILVGRERIIEVAENYPACYIHTWENIPVHNRDSKKEREILYYLSEYGLTFYTENYKEEFSSFYAIEEIRN